ncbi:hypothetical protein WL38_20310 [Burkholderia ubonensis]|nr:hypothetical protein WL38_20310 [Burkholderia ubonensis]
MELFGVCKELGIQRLRVRRIMGISMAVRAQGHAVPDSVSFFHPEDVVHIKKSGIVLLPPASGALTAMCAGEHRAANLRIAFDLRAHRKTTLTAVAADTPRVAHRTVVIGIVNKLLAPSWRNRELGQIDDAGPVP